MPARYTLRRSRECLRSIVDRKRIKLVRKHHDVVLRQRAQLDPRITLTGIREHVVDPDPRQQITRERVPPQCHPWSTPDWHDGPPALPVVRRTPDDPGLSQP